MYKCKYCSKEFEKPNQLGGHIGRCKMNPNREANCKKYEESCKKANQIQIQKKNIIQRDLTCKKCGKHYTLMLSDRQYESGKYSKFCSRSCANSRGKYSEERKEKIRQGVQRHLDDIGYVKKIKIRKQRPPRKSKSQKSPKPKIQKIKITTRICENCGKEFEESELGKKSKYCCKECMKQSRFKKLSIAGKKSASIQRNERRSKNEKLLCDLCEQYFDKVGHNEPIFNGWDADVLIYDLKIAILWNGVWHYKKITKQHSVKQVQNRDKIKINEIKQSGWIPYIIKDEGKYNPGLVKEKFDEFIKYINYIKRDD